MNIYYLIVFFLIYFVIGCPLQVIVFGGCKIPLVQLPGEREHKHRFPLF